MQTARERQEQVYLGGARGARPAVPIDPARLERAAEKAMSAEAFAYVAGGAGRETTMDANRAALDRRRILPRVLRDVSARDTSIELFGRRLPSPLLLAPIGVLEMAHDEADRAVARAAARVGVPFVFSSQASVPMEDCAEAMEAVRPGAPRFFQLYWSTSDALVESFVQRAEACGCSAVVLTLDTTLLGWRPRDLDLAYLPFLRGKGIAQYTSDPVFQAALRGGGGGDADRGPLSIEALRTFAALATTYPGGLLDNLRSGEPLAAVRRFIGTYSRPSISWDDLAWLRERTRLPLVLKGVLAPDDARRALDHGVDGLVVSNHGGRQVDGAVGALDALPGVVEAVDGRMPVLFDSGIRGGADVFKALALGARAVLLGRPYVYGLAVAGEQGVAEVVSNVHAEFELTMALSGCSTVDEIDGGMMEEGR